MRTRRAWRPEASSSVQLHRRGRWCGPNIRSLERRRMAAFSPTSTTEEILKSEPWKQPWWHAGPRDIAILGWVLLIHITAAIGLVLYPIPGWPVFLGALALVFLGGLGTTVGYHRAIAPRSITL